MNSAKKTMIEFSVTSGIGFVLMVLFSTSTPAQEDEAAFQAFLDPTMQHYMNWANVPGAVFTLVQNGEIVFCKGYGCTNVETKTPVDPERTLFRVASLSKPFTATAVMQVVEQGRLDLDREVNQYLKEFQLPDPYGQPITLTHLLTHTAGFDELNIGRASRQRKDAPPLAQHVIEFLPPLLRAPGELCSYSNYGAALAGFLVEARSGFPFHQYMKEKILLPLGMNHSSFDMPEAWQADLAQGYDYKDNEFVPQIVDWDIGYPASMLVTTGEDMGRFMIAHLQGSREEKADNRQSNDRKPVPILQPPTFEAMHARHFTHHPDLDGSALGFFERSHGDLRILEHSGNWSGFISQLCLVPETGRGFFFSFNCDRGSSIRITLLDKVLDHFYPPPPPPASITALADFNERAPRFTGAYRSTREAHTTVEKVAALFNEAEVTLRDDGLIQFWGVPFVETAPLRFEPVNGRLAMAPGPIVFREDESQRITHMTAGRYAYEKLRVYETVSFQLVFVACLAGIYLLSITLWPGVVLVQKLRKKNPPRNQPVHLARIVAWTVSFLNLALPVLLYLIVKDALGENGGEFAYGMPLYALALLLIPHVAAVLTLVMTGLTFVMWAKSHFSFFGRLCYTGVTLAAALYLPLLLYWNLLGFKY